jgi:AGCS family alanine or glycine:cation symporter
VAAAIVPTMATFYLIGALSVILMNYQNIVPSFISIFSDLFTGSSATGGFLGASFAYAFNRGVNRGLFSNEAGQGSAPIAHASAKADEHVSEGMVSLLEPFIDTIFICTITGLVILSSGVWTQKFDNEFQTTDLMIVNGVYSEQNDEDRQALFDLLVNGNTNEVEAYNGTIDVTSGLANNSDFTVIHARSIAEGVAYFQNGELYSGAITVSDGLPTDSSITLRGKSLLHSAALTTMAFTYGFFGQYGQYIVSLSLVLFAFSTAIAWSYYGDRAIIYLVGFKYVLPYRIVYCVAFFVAAFTDTTIVWNFAAVAIVLMTLPNLFGIMMMRKNMKRHVEDYWKQYE